MLSIEFKTQIPQTYESPLPVSPLRTDVEAESRSKSMINYPVLFTHGMPTSSRLWSGILRVVLPLRCEPHL